MTTSTEDLAYVRAAVDRSLSGNVHPSILYIWAAITAVGFLLLDISPERGGAFFVIAGPLGCVVSWIIGYRTALSMGQRDSTIAWAWGLHWTGGIIGGLLMFEYLASMQVISVTSFGHLMLVVVILAYFFAALHLDRIMYVVAGLAVAALIINPVIENYSWTVSGGMISIGMIILAIREHLRS